MTLFLDIADKALNVEDMWKKLTTNWNYINYTLFEQLVLEFGSMELKGKMEEYLDKLTEFQCMTHLNDFIQYFSTMGVLPSEQCSEVSIKINRCHAEYYIDDLAEMTEIIAKKFSLPNFTLRLKDVEIDGITIKWAVPNQIASSVKVIMENTDIRPFCEQHRIAFINVGSEKHKFSSANIIMEVFKWCHETNFPSPITMTQLYSAYACKLILQHCEAEGRKSFEIRSNLEEIPEDTRMHFLKLCRLAWKGIADNQLKFSSTDIAGDTLGLLDEIKGECGQVTYQFGNLTLQNFLSAYHISQLPPQQQEHIIQDRIQTGDLKIIVRFYFGLTKHHEFTSKMISEHMKGCNDLMTAHQWALECGEATETSFTRTEETVAKEVSSGEDELVTTFRLLELLELVEEEEEEEEAPSSIKIPGQVCT